MKDLSQSPDLHPGNAVVAKLYAAVLDNNNMDELFSAWDEFVEHVFEKNPDEAELWRSLLSEHFEQVSSFITIKNPSLAEEKQNFVDKQSFPAILFNTAFRIVAKNEPAERHWSVDLDFDISQAALPPFNRSRILKMAENTAMAEPVLMSLNIGSETYPQIVMAIIHPVNFRTGDGASQETLFIMRIAKPNWRFELGNMLSSTYGLTDAEIEVTRALYENQSLNIIATKRNRSIRTVRTQLSNIFDKTGAASQSELIGMISNLGQILDLEKEQPSIADATMRSNGQQSDLDMRLCRSPDGHVLSYSVYGNPSGKPVFSIQPTVPPEMTKRFRQAAYDSGLYFITPYKPGSGQTSSRNYIYQPSLAAEDFKAILDNEGIAAVDVVGVYAGGVFALSFANKYPSYIKSIILADTGVPFRKARDFLTMSAGSRRTFLPARFFPQLLLSPHKMVAKQFHSSEQGQRKIVKYFFESNPVDKALIETSSEFYDITRDMIGYSFEDTKQLVDTVCLWASNWSGLFDAASTKIPITFVHGEKNDMFLWKSVKNFVTHYAHMTAIELSGQSQLGVFVKPDVFMSIVKNRP